MTQNERSNKPEEARHFEEQETIPLPALNFHHLPTIRQLRETCGLSYFQLAYYAQVSPRVVYWMEQGISVTRLDACRILYALSCKTAEVYTLANIQPVRIKTDNIPPN